jgi:hypothetical protein
MLSMQDPFNNVHRVSTMLLSGDADEFSIEKCPSPAKG